jgi:hypothetical protein
MQNEYRAFSATYLLPTAIAVALVLLGFAFKDGKINPVHAFCLALTLCTFVYVRQ